LISNNAIFRGVQFGVHFAEFEKCTPRGC